MVTRSRLKKKSGRKKDSRLKRYKWRGFEFEFSKKDKTLNMIEPEIYEGIEDFNKEPKEKHFKIVLADWIDLPNRNIPLQEDEMKAMKRFSDKEQSEIFGTTVEGFIKMFDRERTG